MSFPLLNERLSRIPGVVHGFGGSAFTEDDLRAYARERGFRLVLLAQIHSDIIRIIEDAPADRPHGDALATAVSGLLLVIKTADCLPVLLADEKRGVVAAVHAGWRGTRARILLKSVRAVKERFGTNPADLVAALGPCIGPSCYEIGDDVRNEFLAAEFPESLFIPTTRAGKYLFDLQAANVLQLQAAGVPSDRITAALPCTHCDPGLYSFRRDRNTTDRMFSFIGISPR